MEYSFSPPDTMVDSYDKCEFHFADGHISYWGGDVTVEEPNKYHEIITKMDRVNLEYGSPLIKGYFPEEGAFAVETFTLEEGSDATVTYNKVFKPFNCIKVVLTYTSEEGQVYTCTIDCSNERYYALLITFASSEEEGTSSEYKRHLLNMTDTMNGYTSRPHERQINGSNVYLEFGSLVDRNRMKYINNMSHAIPEFQNFSLARSYAKFFIGTPAY